MMGNTQPSVPAVSAVNDLLALMALMGDPEGMKTVLADLKARMDTLSETVKDLSIREVDLMAEKQRVDLWSKEVSEKATQAQSVMAEAQAMKVEYEGRLATLRGLLK